MLQGFFCTKLAKYEHFFYTIYVPSEKNHVERELFQIAQFFNEISS